MEKDLDSLSILFIFYKIKEITNVRDPRSLKSSIDLVKSAYAPASTYHQYIEYKNQLRLFGTAQWYFWQVLLWNHLTNLHKQISQKNQLNFIV